MQSATAKSAPSKLARLTLGGRSLNSLQKNPRHRLEPVYSAKTSLFFGHNAYGVAPSSRLVSTKYPGPIRRRGFFRKLLSYLRFRTNGRSEQRLIANARKEHGDQILFRSLDGTLPPLRMEDGIGNPIV